MSERSPATGAGQQQQHEGGEHMTERMPKSLMKYAQKLLSMTPEEFGEEVKRESARAYEAEGKRHCTHRRYRGHHIECVSLIKRIRWFQCLDCGEVFAPTPATD